MSVFHTKKIKNKNSGFALLFAVLISTLLMAIGLSIFNISVKALSIANSERDSQIAYYAASSALECALYWNSPPSTSGSFVISAFPAYVNGTISTTTTPTIQCNGRNINLNFNCGTSPTCSYDSGSSPFFFFSTTTPVNAFDPDAFINITYVNSAITITSEGHNSELVGRRIERGIRKLP